MTETASGYVERIVYRNEDNGYTVLEMETEDGELMCVGTLPNIAEGEFLEMTGRTIVHPTYGEQFKVETWTSSVPADSKALLKYLGSGAIKGIGQALAARILKKFGDDTLRVLNEEPERLAEVKGISENKARTIALQIEERSQLQNAMIFMSGYGISLNMSLKIYQHYGESLYLILQENPYRLAEDIEGIGFKTADEIAMQAGIRKNSPNRIKSGILYVLSSNLTSGSVYMPVDRLTAEAGELLESEPEEIGKYMTDLVLEHKIVVKNKDRVYSARVYFTELDTARMLNALNVVCDSDSLRVEKLIRRAESDSDIILDELQRNAVAEALKNGLFILTGGPGTGKTTAINTMIKVFSAQHMDILLAAPTGRAAKRMTEACGFEASTIHRMLELTGDPEDPSGRVHFMRNKENPLEADVIIVDEASMIDIFLMHALLAAILPGTRLILVGDVNQLPSVGPGRVLADMIASEEFPVVKLDRIFRQAAASDIIVNAHRINAGEEISLDNKSRDFFFLERPDVRVVQKVVLTLVSEKLPPYVGADVRDIQVLTPMRKGALGVEALNTLLQKYINPPSKDKNEHTADRCVFRVGDKVMQIKNNYQLEWEIRGKYGIAAAAGCGVFNGDLGIIDSINAFNETLTVIFDENRYVEYSFRQLDELELAYAVTVHKSQGSEYPAVVIPILSGPAMLMTRNLIYTAVTRAKKCVVITGSRKALLEMIANVKEDERFTSLAEEIRELAEGLV